MFCKFCKKKDNHQTQFCPSAPYTPPLSKRILFVENLLSIPRQDTKMFYDCVPEIALPKVMELGIVFNVGNPWASSSVPANALRSKLGFWKTIGANNSVISWLGYGVPSHFVREPPYYVFPNPVQTYNHKQFVSDNIEQFVKKATFVRAPPGFVKCAHPIVVDESRAPKLRRCDDERWPNSFVPSPPFKMMSLKEDVPIIVEKGDVFLTRDLENAYYKIPVAEEHSRSNVSSGWVSSS